MSRIVARLFALAGLIGCLVAPLAFAQQAAETADRAAIEAAAQAWADAFNARDANVLLALATEDLVLLDPSLAPATGAAAREAWKQALGRAKGPISSASKEIVVAGDVAWRIAAFSFRSQQGEPPRRGQAMEIWKRVGSQWKLHRQMSSNLLTQPKLVPQPLPPDPVLDRPTN